MPTLTTKFETLIIPADGSRMHNGRRFITPKYVGVDAKGEISALSSYIDPKLAKHIFKMKRDDILTPGLVDTHTHWTGFWGEGMNLDKHALRRGTVLAVDAGSSGCRNIRKEMVRGVIHNPALTGSSRAFINIAPYGLKNEKAENYNLRWHSVEATIAVAQQLQDDVVGVKARLGWLQAASKDDIWKRALKMSAEVATAINKPLMLHIGHGPSIREILDVLNDFKLPIIITHCFQGHHTGSILRYSKREWKAMQERGVIWDLGNGAGSYCHSVAMEGLECGFELMAISTDLHKASVEKQAQDMPHCISKVMSAGVKLEHAIRMSTSGPAAALGLSDEYGSLAVGRKADLTILKHKESSEPVIDFVDYQGFTWTGNEAVFPRAVFKDGELILCA